MKRLVLAASAAVVVTGVMGGSLDDSLAFALDLKEPGFVTQLNFGDALDVGASVGRYGIASDDPTLTAHIRYEDVDLKAYPWVTNRVPVLYLPQPSRVNASDPSKVDVNSARLDFKDANVTNLAQTAFVRFRWDGAAVSGRPHCCFVGNGFSWGNATGWELSVVPDSDGNKGYLGAWVGRQSKCIDYSGRLGSVEKGVWYDLFTDIYRVNDSTTRVQFYLYRTGDRGAEGYPAPKAESDGWDAPAALNYGENPVVMVGGMTGSAGWKEKATVNDDMAKCFRGSIAKCEIYSKLLSEAERSEVMSGMHGATWKIGVENGSTNEFAAADPVETFVPSSNRWSEARCELTEANPSFVMKDALIAAEERLNKILEIVPIVSGAGPFNVEVRVNGELAGTADLSSAQSIHIPGSLWVADEEGNVTVSITRTAPFEGALAFDVIRLCGGWAMHGTMSREGYVMPFHFVGQTGDPKTIQRSSVAGAHQICFHVPATALGEYRYVFEAKVDNCSSPTDVPMISLNGQVVSDFSSLVKGGSLTLPLPDRALIPGQNVLELKNASGWVSYTRYSITEKPNSGFMIFMR